MIKANDIIGLVKVQLSNWNISRDDDALYQYLNMGLSDLYEKFNIGIKSETVTIVSEQAVYQLKSSEANLIIRLYDETGRELQDNDVVGGKGWEYKLVNYKTFILNKPYNGLMYVLYKSAPIEVKDTNDILDIPSIFKEVLMLYMMYLGTSTIRSDASKDSGGWDARNHFIQIYNGKCQELAMNGYQIGIGIESLPINIKGYV